MCRTKFDIMKTNKKINTAAEIIWIGRFTERNEEDGTITKY